MYPQLHQHNYFNAFWLSVRERMVLRHNLHFSYIMSKVEDLLLCKKCDLFVFLFLWTVTSFVYFSAGMLAFFYRLVGIPDLFRTSAICRWYELQVLLPVCHLFFVFVYGIRYCSWLFVFGVFWKRDVLVGWTVTILYYI